MPLTSSALDRSLDPSSLTGKSSNVRSSKVRPSNLQSSKIIKADLVDRVVADAEVPRVTAAQAVDAILDGMKTALADGKRIELRGFGVFQVRARKKGMGRNPRTGDEVPIAPGKTVRFKPGKELRDIS